METHGGTDDAERKGATAALNPEPVMGDPFQTIQEVAGLKSTWNVAFWMFDIKKQKNKSPSASMYYVLKLTPHTFLSQDQGST